MVLAVLVLQRVHHFVLFNLFIVRFVHIARGSASASSFNYIRPASEPDALIAVLDSSSHLPPGPFTAQSTAQNGSADRRALPRAGACGPQHVCGRRERD